MGLWYSTPKNVVFPEKETGVAPRDSEKIPIRHRPTCVNSDIEVGITEETEKHTGEHTKTQ